MQGCILPSAIAVLVDRVLDPESSDTDDLEWVQDWLAWIEEVTGRPAETLSSIEEREMCVAEVCQSFAAEMKFATKCAVADDLDPEPESDD
jgi:hypothetical protein